MVMILSENMVYYIFTPKPFVKYSNLIIFPFVKYKLVFTQKLQNDSASFKEKC